MQEQSVVALKKYGEIQFHVGEWMDRHGVTKGALARLANIRYEVAKKWYNGDIERIDADVLARICYVLDCDLHDLISYHK